MPRREWAVLGLAYRLFVACLCLAVCALDAILACRAGFLIFLPVLANVCGGAGCACMDDGGSKSGSPGRLRGMPLCVTGGGETL